MRRQVEVYNQFHTTVAMMTVDGHAWETRDGDHIAGTVSSAEVARVSLKLCGMRDCACPGLHVNIDETVFDAEGNKYSIEG